MGDGGMSAVASLTKRNKEILTALIYCVIFALTELAMFVIQKSSMDGALTRIFSEVDLRLIFLPCASLIYLLKGEKKTAMVFAFVNCAATAVMIALGFAGVIKGMHVGDILSAVLKAAILIIACLSNAKLVRYSLMAAYAAAEILRFWALQADWGIGVTIAWIVVMVPSIFLWVKALQPEQDIYTGLYNVSSVHSIQRLLSLAVSFICGFLFMIIAISLMGSYADNFTSTGIYTVLISCVLAWFSAFILLNLAD